MAIYTPPTFLTPQVLADVLAEFEWRAPYTLEEDEPDGVFVHFPLSVPILAPEHCPSRRA